MYDVCFYFFLFMIMGILGWISECIMCSYHQKKFVHDRGFLLGPYCPVYGWGALYMYIFLSGFSNNPILLFVMAVIGTSVLEYLTSYVMEKAFNARWWDYSNDKYNLAGRVCLRNAILFGVAGLGFIYLFKPFYIDLVDKIPYNIFIIINIILFIIYIIDNIITYTIMGKIKKDLLNVKKDSTSEIDKQVKEVLSHHTFSTKRLLKSFPNMTVNVPGSEAIVKSIKATISNMDEFRKENRKKIKKIKEELKKSRK